MDFGIFDADQHYYEAEDCFTRFASKRMQGEKFVDCLKGMSAAEQKAIMRDNVQGLIAA